MSEKKRQKSVADSLGQMKKAGEGIKAADLTKSLGMQVASAKAAQLARATAPPSIPVLKPRVDGNLASEFYRRLVEWIQRFEDGLDAEHEVGVRLVSFGQALTFHLHEIGYWNPSLISFKGTSQEGQPVELIQHVSQISVLLITLNRQDTSRPKRRVGFTWADDAEQTEPGDQADS